MTIDKAIEYLGIMLGNYDRTCPFDEVDALTLGIEALKRVKESRKKAYFTTRSPLSGETKEKEGGSQMKRYEIKGEGNGKD